MGMGMGLGMNTDVYAMAQLGPSTASLIQRGDSPSGAARFDHDLDDDEEDDDGARLTAHMSRSNRIRPRERGALVQSPEGSYSSGGDPEFEGAASAAGGSGGPSPGFGTGGTNTMSPRSTTTTTTRQRTLRYSVSPSPLKKTESAVRSAAKGIRRMSLRVVNLANTGLEGQLRLGDGEDDDDGEKRRLEEVESDDEGPPQPDLRKVLPIRGRTLGCFGPRSRVRLALFRFLVHPCVHPCVILGFWNP